jgi:predicted ester cyclase
MNREQMLSLVSKLAEAKSRQNVEEALQVCHAEMLLETPALRSVARGTEENRVALSRFFKAFPDYEVKLEHHIVDAGLMVCWGTAHMTMTGTRFGVEPSGRRAVLPVIIEFRFKDGLICHERFNYDLSVLCAQSGVSTDAVRVALFGSAWEGQSVSSAAA